MIHLVSLTYRQWLAIASALTLFTALSVDISQIRLDIDDIERDVGTMTNDFKALLEDIDDIERITKSNEIIFKRIADTQDAQLAEQTALASTAASMLVIMKQQNDKLAIMQALLSDLLTTLSPKVEGPTLYKISEDILSALSGGVSTDIQYNLLNKIADIDSALRTSDGTFEATAAMILDDIFKALQSPGGQSNIEVLQEILSKITTSSGESELELLKSIKDALYHTSQGREIGISTYIYDIFILNNDAMTVASKIEHTLETVSGDVKTIDSRLHAEVSTGFDVANILNSIDNRLHSDLATGNDAANILNSIDNRLHSETSTGSDAANILNSIDGRLHSELSTGDDIANILNSLVSSTDQVSDWNRIIANERLVTGDGRDIADWSQRIYDVLQRELGDVITQKNFVEVLNRDIRSADFSSIDGGDMLLDACVSFVGEGPIECVGFEGFLGVITTIRFNRI